MSNVYTPPSADMSNSGQSDATYEPKVFSLTGRIGRLRLMAYGLVLGVAMTGAAVVVALLGVLLGKLALVLGFALFAAAFVLGIAMSVRRLHDLNHTGWLVLLNFVPIVGALFGLYVLFAPGSSSSNNYGPPPSPNPTWVVVCAWFFPVLIAVSIFAAMSSGVYQTYLDRAAGQGTQSESSL